MTEPVAVNEGAADPNRNAKLLARARPAECSSSSS